ncbi:natterin-3-like isoform X2 [Betta splendens]|uniref:Natterin-3-like isoform X2 n=1 Tax=Betta splendens TaxID=158456 RepID=A0A9W2XDK2_BETSP|nr:natterin-3-like isoform X2 [Betta splendens]
MELHTMKLLVMLMLALPTLPLESSKKVTESVRPLNPSLGNKIPEIRSNRPGRRAARSLNHGMPYKKQNCSHFVNIDQTNLEWQTWCGSLPNGAVLIYNKYVGRTDYVCKHDCDAGFYRPDEGPFCHYSDKEVGHETSQFEILVNKQNTEILEWKEASRGSVPQHSVLTCPDKKNVYVGMNKYGLGKVVPQEKAFFLPWHKKEYWYNDYQVLTFSKDVVSEDIYDVKYKMDQAKIIKFPQKTIDTLSISNNLCQSVLKTMTLSKTTQESQRWEHSFSVQMGVKISFEAEIPMLASTGVELRTQVSYQFTKETTHTESNNHLVSITYDVPPNHFCTVRMVGRKSEVTVPYTARLRRTYRDGQTREASFSGTYKGVQFGEVHTILDRCVLKADNKPCPEKQVGCQ